MGQGCHVSPPEAAPAGAPRAHAERRDALPSDPIARPGTVRDDLAADPSGLTAVFIEQGRRLAEMQAPAGDFVRDPLQPRSAGLPAVPAERFAMRGPLSPQKAVRMIGVLFGGPGYATDPCPRIRDNIEALKTTGASDLLQEELRRDKAHCR